MAEEYEDDGSVPMSPSARAALFAEFRDQLEKEKKGPTHIADIALKNANMEIHKVRVDVPYQAFPKALYRKVTKRGREVVEAKSVKSQAEEDRLLADKKAGWQVAVIEVQYKEQEDPNTLTARQLSQLLGSVDPSMPMGRTRAAAV